MGKLGDRIMNDAFVELDAGIPLAPEDVSSRMDPDRQVRFDLLCYALNRLAIEGRLEIVERVETLTPSSKSSKFIVSYFQKPLVEAS